MRCKTLRRRADCFVFVAPRSICSSTAVPFQQHDFRVPGCDGSYWFRSQKLGYPPTCDCKAPSALLQYQTRQQHPHCLLSSMLSFSTGAAFAVLSVTSLSFLVLNGLLTWLRTAWMLRKLPKGSKNMLNDVVMQMFTPNRLGALQRMNNDVVNGSGVFFFNKLWRQVSSDVTKAPKRLKAGSSGTPSSYSSDSLIRPAGPSCYRSLFNDAAAAQQGPIEASSTRLHTVSSGQCFVHHLSCYLLYFEL